MICMLMHMFGQRHAAQPGPAAHADRSPARSAREVLDRRYASGEIGYDEYRRIKQVLQTEKGTP